MGPDLEMGSLRELMRKLPCECDDVTLPGGEAEEGYGSLGEGDVIHSVLPAPHPWRAREGEAVYGFLGSTMRDWNLALRDPRAVSPMLALSKVPRYL